MNDPLTIRRIESRSCVNDVKRSEKLDAWSSLLRILGAELLQS